MSCNIEAALQKAGYTPDLNGEDYVAEYATNEQLGKFLGIVMRCVGCPNASFGQAGCGISEDIVELAEFRSFKEGLKLPDELETFQSEYRTRRLSRPQL